jgi:hypothetical protein
MDQKRVAKKSGLEEDWINCNSEQERNFSAIRSARPEKHSISIADVLYSGRRAMVAKSLE